MEAEKFGSGRKLLHVFMPPLRALDDYLDLLAAGEATAAELRMKVIIEGYPPPRDARLKMLQVTPDPGVIEVNIHPASNWDQLVGNTEYLYQSAHETWLSSEKFMLDGRHTGTGGGNHLVLGGAARRQSIPATPRPAGEPDCVLAQPSFAVVPVFRPLYRTDEPGAARRRSAQRPGV